MFQSDVQIRRQVLRMAVGASLTIETGDLTPAEAEAVALRFARSRGLRIRTAVTQDGLSITRVADNKLGQSSRYPEIDTLEIGASHLFPYPPQAHQAVRQQASIRNRTGDVRLVCNSEPGGIRVTRLPIGDEAQTCGPVVIPTPPRATKYGIERLAEVPELRLSLPPADHQRLRLAASQKAKAMGWTVRCRLQDDGTILVYRTDPGRPTAEAQ